MENGLWSFLLMVCLEAFLVEIYLTFRAFESSLRAGTLKLVRVAVRLTVASLPVAVFAVGRHLLPFNRIIVHINQPMVILICP